MNIRASATFRPRDLAALEQLIAPRVIAATQAATEAVAEEARAIVPVDTGALRASIASRTEWIGRCARGYVMALAPHAAFVEFGTGLTGIGTYPYSLPVLGVPFTGSWIYDYKRQKWHGMAAQPYLRPSLDTSRPAILRAYAEQGFAVAA